VTGRSQLLAETSTQQGENKIMKAFLWVLVIGIIFVQTTTSCVFAEEIRISGGGASITTVFAPIKPYFEKATGITLLNLQSTPKNGLIDLANGKVDAATGAVPLEAMIGGAAKDGVNIDPAGLQQTVVATNKTVVFIHKDNPVARLSREQLKGIFTGKIGNWKEVGGSDREIIVVWGKNTPGQNALFVKRVLDGASVLKETLETTDYAGIRQNIGFNPDSIGIDPLAMADASVKVVEAAIEVTSPIILVTKGKPTGNVQKLLDFIKGAGSQYIKQ
jgi:phosphate transport system substrate-binding protein